MPGLRDRRIDGRPWLFAHRGASAELPENTLAAFQRAVDIGVDALELDVHLTADGHVVVAHDADGARMAGVEKAIRDCPLDEVAGWDVGWGFVRSGARPHAGAGHRIPTLATVLETWPTVPLNIDLKQSAPSIVSAILRTLRDHGAEARCLLASFSRGTLRELRAAGHRGPTGSSRGEVTRVGLLPGPLARRVPGDRVQVPVAYRGIPLAAPWFVDRVHRLGKAVDFWTIDDPAEARRLLALGADGLMTNDPAGLRSEVAVGPPQHGGHPEADDEGRPRGAADGAHPA